MSQPLSTRACGLSAGGRSPGSRAYPSAPSRARRRRAGGCVLHGTPRWASPVTVAGPRRIRTGFPSPPTVWTCWMLL